MFRKLVSLIFCLVITVFRLHAGEEITNPYKTDGFGSQFQTIIYSIVYAELKDKTFLYTPFRKMEHNYDDEGDFLRKKEVLINLIDHFPLNKDRKLQKKITDHHYINFFEGHLYKCSKSKSLKKIKKLFRANKNRADFYDERYLNIAVHVRRPNAHDSRVYGTDTPDQIYIRLIEELRNKYFFRNPLFHIFSQGDEAQFRQIFPGNDVVFHINESIEDSFTSLVLADVLVTSPSAFSHTAGLISEGTVYYMPFYHKPLPSWIVIDIAQLIQNK